MFKKLIVLLCLFHSTITLAEICPSVGEIKNNDLHGWSAYDSDDGSQVSSSAFLRCKNKVQQFAMAEWAEGAPEGESHCYYFDKNQQYMDVFLAHPDLQADASAPNWRFESGFLRCHGNPGNCVFLEKRYESRHSRR